MVSLAVSSMFFHEYTLPEIFSFVGKSGLDAIEFWLETPHFWLRDMPFGEVTTCRKAHPELATLNIHAPILDLNPCSINPEVAAVSVQYAVRSVGIASSVGARVLTVHPGRRTAKRPPGNADFARFDLYISALRTAARENGVKVAIENMEPAINSLLCTPERLRSLLDEEPWLYFTLDTSHALVTSADEPFRYIELCHDRLANVHISRIQGKTLHLPLDRDPLMASILASLRDHQFNGSLTLEIDDLNFGRTFSAEEKTALLAADGAFIRDCMC
jgi:sugar phosphate isomerase/epimerase